MPLWFIPSVIGMILPFAAAYAFHEPVSNFLADQRTGSPAGDVHSGHGGTAWTGALDDHVVKSDGGGRGTAAVAASSWADELEVQAEIAECLAGEARRKAAAWALDVRSSRGHAPLGYEAEMAGMIAVSIERAGAMEAWAGAVRQAGVDGSLTADERTMIEAAERDMVDADKAVHDALISTLAWRATGMSLTLDTWIADANRQLLVLSGDGTDCY